MAWIVTALFAGFICVMISVYNRALTEAGAMRSLLLMCLLNDSTYASQKNGLLGFIANSEAKDAHDLSVKVLTAMSELALKMVQQDATFHLGVSGFLWKTREEIKNKSASTNR